MGRHSRVKSKNTNIQTTTTTGEPKIIIDDSPTKEFDKLTGTNRQTITQSPTQVVSTTTTKTPRR